MSKLRCRYSDCVEGHATADDEERVTCPTCRRDLGLPPLDESFSGKENVVVRLPGGDRHYMKGALPANLRRTGNGFLLVTPLMKTVCDITVALCQPVDDDDLYLYPMTCMICLSGGADAA